MHKSNAMTKDIQRSVYSPAVARWMRRMGWFGVTLVVLAAALFVVQAMLGCSLVGGCAEYSGVKWTARLAISGLLLGFLGFLER